MRPDLLIIYGLILFYFSAGAAYMTYLLAASSWFRKKCKEEPGLLAFSFLIWPAAFLSEMLLFLKSTLGKAWDLLNESRQADWPPDEHQAGLDLETEKTKSRQP